MSLPASAQGAVAMKWGPFIDALNLIPTKSHVHWVVRGWDGLSTQQLGLEAFIKHRCAGYTNDQQLTIEWTHIQARAATGDKIQNLFGHPNPALGPVPPSHLWWPPPPQDPLRPEHPGLRLERILRARPHPPFSHYDYMQTIATRLPQAGNQAARNTSPCLCLLWVWAQIDAGKAAGNLDLRNDGRSTFA
jgi:hypothetical protein